MRSRYRFKVLPSTYRRRELARVLEATEGSLRLFMPRWPDRIVNLIINSAVFIGFLAAATLLVRILPLQILSPFEAVLTATLLALILIVTYFYGALGDRVATNVELRLVARRPGRVLNVHVQQIRPGKTLYAQFVKFADDSKEEFQVLASREKLQEALRLARETNALT